MTREDGRQHQHLSSQGRNYCNWSLTATVYMSNNVKLGVQEVERRWC
jgi:hypothetical protein